MGGRETRWGERGNEKIKNDSDIERREREREEEGEKGEDNIGGLNERL